MVKRRRNRITKRKSPFTTECSFVLVEPASATTKITATDESLLTVHKKIHLHLTGRKILSKFKIRKLNHILNRMHCPSYKEQEYLMLAQGMLNQICCNSMETDSQETDISGFGKTIQDQENTDNTISVLSSPAENNVNQSAEKLTDKSFNNETTVINLTQNSLINEKENIPINPLSSNVIKLNFNTHHDSNDGSLSFPLELLTNTNFLDTPRTTNAGAPEQYSKDIIALSDITNLENSAFSGIINMENGGQSLKNFGVSTNESIFNSTEHEPLESSSEFNQNVAKATISGHKNNTSNLISSILSATDNTSNMPEPLQSSSEEIIWKKPKNIPLSVSKTYNSSVSTISEKDAQSLILDYKIPSEGLIWKEGNVKISQASEFEYNESTIPEIISINSDTTNVDNITTNLEIEVVDTENELSQPTDEASPDTNCLELIHNTPDNLIETRRNSSNKRENESLVFNVGTTWDCNYIREGTTFIEYERDRNQLGNSMKQLSLESLLQKSVIDETPEIIIDETEYVNSESSVLKKYDVTNPYQNAMQSDSFLNYKTSGQSNRILSFKRRRSQHSGEDEIPNSTEQNAQTENILVVNGAIPKKQDSKGRITPMITEEVIDSDRIKALQEKIMKRRQKYEAKWEDMSINEKVSTKFIDEFHVNIFEEPVEALLDINYKPNLNRFWFPRLTNKEMYEQMEPSWEKMNIMNAALTKVITELVEKSKTSSAVSLFGKSTNDSDSSDSFDEENASNKEWLKEYFRNMKRRDQKDFMENKFKERQEVEQLKNERGSYEDQDKGEELAQLLTGFSDFDWLEEQ